jgi:soluble lytic murein transglycosylase-like protein
MNRISVMLLLAFLTAAVHCKLKPRRCRNSKSNGRTITRANTVFPPELVIAIIHVQSRWQPYAVSEKGAAGLMQLLPATAYRFGVTNRFVVQETFVAESPIWPISCISLAEICGW